MSLNHTKNFAAGYGPWAVVTGSSSGIGQELALQIAARGLNVCLSGRDANRLNATARIIHTMGRKTLIVAGDLAQPAGVAALLDASSGLEVGLLVPAAGFGSGGAFLDSSATEQSEMIALNCTCVMTMVHHYAPPMVKRGHGGVMLIASLLAFQGTPYAAHYAATKAYVQCFGEALNVELAGTGVHVLVTSPGPTETGFAERARMRLGKTMSASTVAKASLDALGRSGTLLPGGLTKALRGAMFGLPRGTKVWMMGRIMKGMT